MINRESGVMKAWEFTVRKTQAVAKKRANSIFGIGAMYMAQPEEGSNNNNKNNNQSEENPEALEIYHAERVLPNGDYYKGQWADSFPHGHGKYLWTDGCMYVGEWYKGKTMGRGRFSWPSGATYEGEFKGGYMDGTGLYTAASGDTYKGQWSMNLKHGHGVKLFVNGDKYEGEWKRGMEDGQGSYQWKNGNQYVGEWRNGSIWGKGTFVWGNGNRYEGYWEDGMPKGSGSFKWAEGGVYVGNWSKDPKDQNGMYYPAGSSQEEPLEWDPQDVYIELSGCQVCEGEKVAILPSQKKLAVWRSTKSGDVKPRRRSVDGRVSVGVERPSDRMNIWEGGGDHDVVGGGDRTPTAVKELNDGLLNLHVDQEDAFYKGGPLPTLKAPRKSKRQGDTICRGHKNFELMLNLQLGIRFSFFYFVNSFFFLTPTKLDLSYP